MNCAELTILQVQKAIFGQLNRRIERPILQILHI